MDSLLLPGNGKILTGRTECDHIHRFNLRSVYFRHAAQMLHARKSFLGHANGIWFYLAGPYGRESILVSGKRESAAAVKEASDLHLHPTRCIVMLRIPLLSFLIASSISSIVPSA